jgi:two-component system CheB/CheR fusion protein
VDYVLSPKAIARELARLARHPYVSQPSEEEAEGRLNDHAGLNAIFHMLRRATGLDFANYRKTTILRRIQRRMLVHKMEKLGEYVKYVQTSPQEIKALYQDMLINVTSFFRNPEVFEALKNRFFSSIIDRLQPDRMLRIWIPACASGEEAYSVAIALLEFLGPEAAQTPVQLFGTDVSEISISKARNGVYPENIQADVSPERLRKYFNRTEGGYRISKHIRDMCIFAPHNVLSDPPFSRMDLVCCRNLLIYLEPMLQSKVISLFHYALQPDGILVLGTSEGLGTAGNLFSVEDRGLKIFSKKTHATRPLITFSLANPVRGGQPPQRGPVRHSEGASTYLEAQKEFDRQLLLQFSPPTVFVNDDLEVVHSRGNVSRYLKLAPGRASLSILKMAREGLMLELRSALNKAKKEGVTVRKQRISIQIGNGNGSGSETRRINLEVVPLTVSSAKETYFMIIFDESGVDTDRKGTSSQHAVQAQQSARVRDVVRLEQELAATKEYLQSIIETHQATNEELQSANEEILSSNEELQSTNEELETAKEELQSTNEELSTVNDELRNRNQEISDVNRDLTNLLAVIEIAVVIIGRDLTIRRFTPLARQIFGLIPADIGRPLTNINPTLDLPDFHTLVLQVVSDSRPVEREVTDKNGARYLLKIKPYPTTDEGKPDGAVITAAAKP